MVRLLETNKVMTEITVIINSSLTVLSSAKDSRSSSKTQTWRLV